MMMGIASVLLRLALGAGFLSAVASRLNLVYRNTSGWNGFIDYTAQVNSFLPKTIIPTVAVTATVLETCSCFIVTFWLSNEVCCFRSSGTFPGLCCSNGCLLRYKRTARLFGICIQCRGFSIGHFTFL